MPTFREVKLKGLPKLGRKDKEGKFTGEPYLKWAPDSVAVLDAVGGTHVLRANPPLPTAPEAQRAWYHTTNAIVYNELLSAVRGIPTLESNVRRCQPFQNSSRVAWKVIADFYVHLSETNQETLQKKLHKLIPGASESMQSLIARAEDLRKEFLAYGILPKDEDFVTQILSHLTLPWRDALEDRDGNPMGKRLASQIPWEDLASSLLEQDNRRRNSFLDAPDALLPLGFTRKEQGKGKTATGETGTVASVGGHAKAKPKGRPWTPPAGKEGGQTRGYDNMNPLVCYCCLKSGHGSNTCPDRKPDWRLTPKRRAEAEKLRKARGEQRRNDKARAAQARVAGSGEPAGAGPSSPGSK